MTEAYPLQWPAGKPRTQYPASSRFGGCSMDFASHNTLYEIRKLGGTSIVVSTNIRLRQDGLPYSNQRQPEDKGVAVYFSYKGKQMCFACDRWDRVECNLWAIAKTIGALRGIERWGSGDMVQQAFTGFVALPSPKKPEDILGIRQGASHDEIDRAWREKAKKAHPDAGGTTDEMQEINEARRRLLA